jgi:hypothetical protein
LEEEDEQAVKPSNNNEDELKHSSDGGFKVHKRVSQYSKNPANHKHNSKIKCQCDCLDHSLRLRHLPVKPISVTAHREQDSDEDNEVKNIDDPKRSDDSNPKWPLPRKASTVIEKKKEGNIQSPCSPLYSGKKHQNSI